MRRTLRAGTDGFRPPRRQSVGGSRLARQNEGLLVTPTALGRSIGTCSVIEPASRKSNVTSTYCPASRSLFTPVSIRCGPSVVAKLTGCCDGIGTEMTAEADPMGLLDALGLADALGDTEVGRLGVAEVETAVGLLFAGIELALGVADALPASVAPDATALETPFSTSAEPRL